jgi:nucleoside-diphosphate-sugar epimerase
LVTGGFGFVGRALVEQLVRDGWEVIALTRSPDRASGAPVLVARGDLATGEGISAALLDGVDTVFHCAGELSRPAAMRAVHVTGTRRLLECVRAAGRQAPLHWVQLSSVGAYGPALPASSPRVVDESTPERPLGEYETTKTEADRLVVDASAEGLITFAMLRPANVVGRGMPGRGLPRVISLIRRGWFFHVGAGDAVANYVHVDDVAAALLACAKHPASAGQVFNLSSDCSWAILADHIARAVGARPRALRLPERPLRAAARVLAAVPGSPLTPARLDALTTRTRYPIHKIETTLGFRLVRPMPESVGDILDAVA